MFRDIGDAVLPFQLPRAGGLADNSLENQFCWWTKANLLLGGIIDDFYSLKSTRT